MSNTEIATKNQAQFQLSIFDEESSRQIAEVINRRFGGMTALELPRAKTPSGGMTVWSVSQTPDDPEPEMLKELIGVIIYDHPSNAYWANPYGGAGAMPDCTSTDGVEGIDAQTGEAISCATCRYNKFGSGTTASGQPGRGKACKNGHKLYILREDEYLPTVVMLPPTALRAYSGYVQQLIFPRKPGDKMLEPDMVATSISLKACKNADGIAYAAPTFRMVEALDEAKINAIRGYAASFKGAANKASAADYAQDVF